MVLRSIFLATISVVGLAAAGERPNIVLILADDLGFGDLGCYGQEVLKTPHIDQLAADGMRFTRHYAGSTVCAPSRCVLMTGLHTGNCPVPGNHQPGMPEGTQTVATVLREGGYETACIGKWGIGNPPEINDPAIHGFQHFYGYVNMFHAHNFYPEFLYRNGEREELRNVLMEQWADHGKVGSPHEGAGVAAQKVDYAPDLIHEEALGWLDGALAKPEVPFFLYYALNIPHANNEGQKEGPEHGMEIPGLDEFQGGDDWPIEERGFALMLERIDSYVGDIVARIDGAGASEETLVIFSSDNGPHEEGHHTMEFFNSNGLLRGMKRDLFEGGVRVPFVVRWPGQVEAGGTTEHLAAFQDFLPTVCEVAGLEPSEKVDGLSFLPTLLGEDGQEEHPYLYWSFLEQGGKEAVLKDGWKAVRYYDFQESPQRMELYRLEEDPAEEFDVSAKHPKLVEEMEVLMAKEGGD